VRCGDGLDWLSAEAGEQSRDHQHDNGQDDAQTCLPSPHRHHVGLSYVRFRLAVELYCAEDEGAVRAGGDGHVRNWACGTEGSRMRFLGSKRPSAVDQQYAKVFLE
jgi:hypothetical protein